MARLKAEGQSQSAIAKALGRHKSTISRELRRNALESGAYRPEIADGAYLLRRQRRSVLEKDKGLRTFVSDRLCEGWTPEQIAGRLRCGIERGLRPLSFETIYRFVYADAREGGALWRHLPRHHKKRRPMRARRSRDAIKDKTHISERSEAANAREEAGHWEGDLVICKRARPVLVLHERKTRITFMARLMGKTAAETVSAIMAVFKRLAPPMRGSITFDNGTEFAAHGLLRGMLSATTYFCDAYASWRKGGVENQNGRIRRWLLRSTDLDDLTDADIEEIAMTMNLTPRKRLGSGSPVEAFLGRIGSNIEIRFNALVALRA